MISGECILCMPLTTWDNAYTNTVVKMMSLLSRENKILFVDYQFTFKDIFNSLRRSKKLPVKRILGAEPRMRKVKTVFNSEIFVLNPPPVFPSNKISSKDLYRLILKLNATIVRQSVKKALDSLEMKNPIVINGYNSFLGLPLAGTLNEKLNVYYCYDEIKGDIWYKNHGPTIEEEYMKKADLVIATSDALHASKSNINSNCFVVKNGVDFELFHSAFDFTIQKEKKIVSYAGSVDERFDTELVSHVAQSCPFLDFHFIGRITNPGAKVKLEKFSNVKFLGSKQPAEVPYYLKEADVCIIPYLKNEVTKGVYPLKINEYLAAGKPVVMTAFAPLEEFKDVVSIAKSKEEFIRHIENELASDSREKRLKRAAVARNNSWENRAEELSAILSEALKLKRKVYA